jgi:hypothetical protein
LDECDEGGEPVFIELERKKTDRDPTTRRLPDGTRIPAFRWANEYELPEAFGGGGVLRVRTDEPREDRRREGDFLRTRYVSVIPSTDPDFKRLFGLREDAESINSIMKSALWLRRAHSLGRLRQHMDMIAFALTVNSLALQVAARAAPQLDSVAA